MARLITNRYGEPSKEVRIEPPGVVLGTGTGCDVVLTGMGISSWHARIRMDERGAVVEPLSPRSRVLLNGGPVTKRSAVADGDRIGIGDYEIEYKGTAATAPPPERPPDVREPTKPEEETPVTPNANFAARPERETRTPHASSGRRRSVRRPRASTIRRWGRIVGVATAVVVVGLCVYWLFVRSRRPKRGETVHLSPAELARLEKILVHPDNKNTRPRNAGKAVAARKKLPKRQGTAEQHLEKARQAFAAGRFDEAIGEVRNALAYGEKAVSPSSRDGTGFGKARESAEVTAKLREALRRCRAGNGPGAVSKVEKLLDAAEASGLAAAPDVMQRARLLLSRHYCAAAESYFRSGDFELAKVCWVEALRINHACQQAQAGLHKLEAKAKALYEDGAQVGAANTFYTLSKWRQAVRIAPPESPYRQIALRAIAQLAAR